MNEWEREERGLAGLYKKRSKGKTFVVEKQ